MARRLASPVELNELAGICGAIGADRPSGLAIYGLGTLQSARADEVSFYSAARHRGEAVETRAAAVVVSSALEGDLPEGVVRLVVPDPYRAFASLVRWFEARLDAERPRRAVGGIHPLAVLGEGAHIDPSACIAAGAVVGCDAWIGAKAVVGSGATLGDRVRLGARSVLRPGVHVADDCDIGSDCIIHSGTVVGADGFGFARAADGAWEKIPQLGRVVIGDSVEIGANCCIDRGALDDTVIARGVKLDNLIQVGHNVRIGEDTAIAGCVGIAGSAVIGARCMIGGGAGILGHLEICDDVVVSAMSLVTRSIRRPGFYSGVFPLMDNAAWEKVSATLKRLPSLRDAVRNLSRSDMTGDTTEDTP